VRKILVRRVTPLLMFWSFLAPALQAPVPGITDSEILIGSCSAMEGPARQLGLHMALGAIAYINMINDQGGINGRKIRLVTHDDSYDPEKAAACFARLQEDHVFAAAFFVGTPTAAKYLPLAEANKIPLIGLFTGAQILYGPFHHYVLNVRASYFDETREQVDGLFSIGMKKIAVIHPNDAFGTTVLDGVKAAMAKHQATPVATAEYQRNTLLVEKAIAVVKAANPDAVVLVGPYAPVAEIIRSAHARNWSPLFLTVSFVGTDEFIREAGKYAEGTVITQVLPPYYSPGLPTVALYSKAMHKYFSAAKPGFVSLEGFVDAMVIAEGLKRAGRDLTREGLINSLESIRDFDLGMGPKLTLSFSSTNHKGLANVYPTVVRNGVAVPLTDWKSVKKTQ